MSNPTIEKVPVWNWVFVPFVITLAVTVLRLMGELNQWSKFWFNPDAGGGAAPIGISWLPPIFGLYFGWKLAKAGQAPPKAGRTILWAISGFALMIVCGYVATLLKVPAIGMGIVFGAASILGAYMAYLPWPAMGRLQFAYALVARVPVAVLMLFAIYGNWGTHYDVAPPDFPQMGLFSKWLIIGLLPQLTVWIAYTMIVGAIFGAIMAKLAARKAPVS